MQKKTLFNPRQTLVLAYLLAVVLWLVRCLAGSAVMLNYKMQGKMPQVTLAPDELTTESFAAYSSNEWWTAPDDDPNWYLSTDSDPHIYWQGQGYIETVELDAAHRLPPGGVALYYLGMLYDHFTIHDFWQIRVPGWVGLVLAAIVIVVLFVQNIGKAAARRRSEKEAARAEDARRKELEEAKSAAFASGQAAAASAQPDPQEKTEEKLE